MSHSISAFFALTTLAAGSFYMVACGGDVSTESSTSISAGAGGAGGAGDAGGSSTSGPGGAGGAGGQPAQCGGFLGAVCPADQWCDFPHGMCGVDDGAGICLPRPTACEKSCPGACACSGMFYCNECLAQAAGEDVDALASCAPPGKGDYSAEAFFGGLDHIFVRKADKARDVCVTIHITRPSEPVPDFAVTLPPDYAVVSGFVTDKASDCLAGTQAAGNVVGTIGAAGSITFDLPPGKFFPCEISVHAEMSFPAGEPWVAPKEPFDADKLVVKDGCL